MSQAKVDRYKEQKRNVKKIMAKEKRSWMMTQIFLIIIAAAVIGWIGVAIYQAVTTPSTDNTAVQAVTYTLDSSALQDYLGTLEEV